jgi:hypothetical protein
MRHISLLGALCLAALPVAAQQRVERRHPASPTTSVRLTVLAPRAEIRVVGWTRDSLVLTGTVESGARVDGGVSADGRGGKFYVESHSAGEGVERLELRVPRGARVWVKASTAEVDVSGISGGLDLNIVGGRIRVAGSPRELNAESMDGDIEVASAVPWLRAKSAAGSITLRGGGDDVAASSVSGRIVVTGGRFVRARFESVTGEIDLDADVERQGMLTVDSHAGDVTLRVPPALPATYDVSTVAGEIVNELTAARAVFARERRSREIGFVTGGGGAQITIRTFKGSVALRRR